MNSKRFFILLLVVAFLKQLLWIALIPIWQTPDEQAHFAQIQNIAENNNQYQYDDPNFKTTSREIEISEILLKTKRDERGNNSYTYRPNFNIEYTNNFVGKYEHQINNQSVGNRKKLTIKEATGYPPLYYQFAGVAYKTTYQAGLIDRIFVIRFWQTIIFLLTVFVYYLSAKLICGEKIDAIYFTIFISFLPMLSFVSAGITSDNLMNLLFPTGLYLCLLNIKIGVKTKNLFLFFVLAVVGILTKPHFIIIIPIYWLSLAVSCAINKELKKFALLNILFVFATPLVFSIFYPVWWADFLITRNLSSLFPEIGNISLTSSSVNMSLWGYLIVSIQKTYRETIPWFWGIFRWLSFSLDRWYYRIWNLITIVSFIFGALFFRKKMKTTIIFMISSVAIYFFILFFWDYLFFLSHGFSFGIQGRYYFPVLFPIIFLIYYYFPFKKLLPVLTIIFNSYALIKLSASYYNFSSLSSFLIQASQYKPWYFKGPCLIFWVAAYATTLAFFLIKLIRDKKEY